MAAAKRKKIKRPVLQLEERVYTPVPDNLFKGVLAVGAIGAALLGAGVYAQFGPALGLREEAHPRGAFILSAGALILALVVLLLPDRPKLVVGDGGVGIDKGPDAATKRIRWCDVERVSIEKDAVAVVGGSDKILASLSAHADAAARIVQEARERMPAVVEISEAESAALGAVDDTIGEVRELAEPQVAGKKCRKSGKLITYEEDARLCPSCGEVYHKDSFPQTCVTCENTTAA